MPALVRPFAKLNKTSKNQFQVPGEANRDNQNAKITQALRYECIGEAHIARPYHLADIEWAHCPLPENSSPVWPRCRPLILICPRKIFDSSLGK